ncbi:hypothetical protein [Paenibacillus macquariensis]|uniref:DUF1963 domain-containing protein n=1 Tax=Paenibacillus macquariensis TaxID=948756 RepID=A0ABY1JVA9_9BACL|nr:hypothetical protein [Paenibacillus macquariensis]MEC0090806.1 hypothetical protein [Paenibacillus macquariensis]OAB34547.1 hypothetical protein PMSM_11830 [Paenibacillus macquariensis subsp. macquariensis]SIQ83252.1 hypothetical protein SAMN05421578_104260 [Paenibacillus macquariensis]
MVHQCQECGISIGFNGICYRCRNKNQREAYQAMNSEEVEKMVESIISNIETTGSWDQVSLDFNGLLGYHDINTARIAQAAFDKGIFYPAAIYRDASPEVRDQLLALLLDPVCEEANHLQLCLALQGDGVVLEQFLRLEKNPLPWRSELYVNPSVYAHHSGWSFDDQGNRSSLYFEQCYTMLPGDGVDQAVKAGQLLEQHCPHCGCRLIDILRLDGLDERFSFLAVDGVLAIPICPNCITFTEETFLRYGEDGRSEILLGEPPFETENYCTEADLLEMSQNQLTLSTEAVPKYYASGGDEVITIGGWPDWVQDVQFGTCPDCSQTMKFLAALPWDVLMDGSEGTLYIEICTDCRTLYLFHQQT